MSARDAGVRRTAGAFAVISYIMKKIKPASLRVLL